MKESNKFFYGWWMVLALMVASSSAIALTITKFNIYLNAFTKDIGVSTTQFALCSTIINITVMLFLPKVEKLLQQHTKKALLFFLISFCLSYATFSFASDVTLLFVASSVPVILMIISMTGSFSLVWLICSVLTVFLLGLCAYGLRGRNAYRTYTKNEPPINSTDIPAVFVLASITIKS